MTNAPAVQGRGVQKAITHQKGTNTMAVTLTATREEVLTTEEVARVLRVSTKTLANWRYLHQGPPHFKHGGCVRYPVEALHNWIAAGTVTSHG